MAVGEIDHGGAPKSPQPEDEDARYFCAEFDRRIEEAPTLLSLSFLSPFVWAVCDFCSHKSQKPKSACRMLCAGRKV